MRVGKLAITNIFAVSATMTRIGNMVSESPKVLLRAKYDPRRPWRVKVEVLSKSVYSTLQQPSSGLVGGEQRKRCSCFVF